MATTTTNTVTKIGWGFGGCNMNCRHCYNASGKRFPVHDPRRLRGIADRLGREGVTDINFGTGEFSVNPQALAVARYLKKKYPAVKLGLTTNGYSVVRLAEKDLTGLFHDIDVSVDFPDQARHNAFRRHPRAWAWAIAALERCRTLGIERSIVACATSQTTDADVLGLLALAGRHGASLRINWFRPTGRGDQSLCLSAFRFWQILRLLSRHAIFEGLSDPLLRAVIGREKSFTPCGCGWSSARIQPDLSVTPCVFLKGQNWGAGPIDTIPLARLRNRPAFMALRDRYPALCRACPWRVACRGGCFSRAHLQAGSATLPDAFCPRNDRRITPLIRAIRRDLVVDSSDKVHHGYLCTLIVKPKEEETYEPHPTAPQSRS